MTVPRRSAVESLTAALAIFGGGLILAAAVLVTVSVALRWITSQGINGDFDLIQYAMPLAVFAFLPWCQLRGGNIFVDTFTLRLPNGARAALDGLWALVYAGVAGLIAWRMAVGAQDAIASGTGSMVLSLPIGWAMALATLFAVWLTIVALLTMRPRA